MDEPFGALDPVTRAEIRREFSRLQRRLHTTVLLVTHDIAEAFALGDRVGVIADGTVVVLGPPAAVVGSGHPAVRALLDALPPIPTGRPSA